MNTTLLDRILNAAREAATGADAMAIEDLQRDLALFPDDTEELSKIEAFDILTAHIEIQPFDVTENEAAGTFVLSEPTPHAFLDWMDELKRLAQ